MSQIDDEEPQLDLHQPLEILRSTVRRLMDRQIPASASKLEEMFAHLKGAVGDSLDHVSQQIGKALELTRESLGHEQPADGDSTEVLERAQDTLSDVQAELQEALANVKASFFSCNSFQECESRLPNLALFESQLEKNLLRLEEAISMATDPEIFGGAVFEPAPTVTDALEALAEGLDLIHQHLQQGEKEPLRQALASVQKAQAGLVAALSEE